MSKNCTGFKSELEKDLNSSLCLGKQLSHFACPRPPLLILVNDLFEDDFTRPLPGNNIYHKSSIEPPSQISLPFSGEES